MNGQKKRVGILISGRGSNMEALAAAADDVAFPAEIACVISNRGSAPGLVRARERGIETAVVGSADHADRAAHDAAIDRVLRDHGVEIVCLAGYMRILTAGFVDGWSGRMINIHPSLLPLFPGLETHARVLDAGMRIHGCSVHFVTAAMDEGPIIAQAAVPVITGDTPDSLARRVLKAEHRLYPMGLRLVCENRVRMESGRAVFEDLPERENRRVLISPEFALPEVDLESLARATP